jgi:hypothetical protein
MKITSWSFSRWDCYNKCPAQANFKFNLKMKEPSSPALERGTALHSLAENWLRGPKIGRGSVGGSLPEELKLIAKPLRDFKKRGAVPEAEFCFDKDWKPVDWFSREAWCRVKADVTIAPVINSKKTPIVEVHDFKSGGKKGELDFVCHPEYELQLDLYSLAGLLSYPTAEKVESSLVFIDHGVVVPNPNVYTQKDVPTLKKDWEKRVKKMLTDEKYTPNPGNACRWCTFSKAKGGMCAY